MEVDFSIQDSSLVFCALLDSRLLVLGSISLVGVWRSFMMWIIFCSFAVQCMFTTLHRNSTRSWLLGPFIPCIILNATISHLLDCGGIS